MERPDLMQQPLPKDLQFHLPVEVSFHGELLLLEQPEQQDYRPLAQKLLGSAVAVVEVQ